MFAVLQQQQQQQQQQHAFKSARFFSARLAVASTTFVPKYRTWRLYLPVAVDFLGASCATGSAPRLALKFP